MNTSKYNLSLFILLLVFLTACSGAPVTPPTEVPPTPTTPKPEIQLVPCSIDNILAQCGTLSVYENRATNTGWKIDIHVALIKASGPNRQPDPIFYIAGGPGASGINDAKYAMLMLKTANQERDLVFFDQRGTGQSNRMACPRDLSESLGLVPLDDQMLQELRACLAQVDGDPRAYTTAWGMDDMDDIRVALGYDKINLYGESYGPFAEQVYLQRHGEHVRAAALEGVSLIDSLMFERMPRSSQEALDLLFTRCESDPACSAAYPNFKSELEAVIARLEEQPVEIKLVDPSTGQPIKLNRDWLVSSIHNVLLATQSAVLLPGIIHQVYQGDWSTVENLLSQDFAPGVRKPEWSVMNLAILCHEEWAITRQAETMKMSAGSYLNYADVRRYLAVDQVCALIPKPYPQALYEPVTTSSVPLLFISNEADPQNPPANIAASKGHYPNSLVLVAPGQGHGYDGFPCRDQILGDFFESGTTEGLNAGCLQDVPLPPFP